MKTAIAVLLMTPFSALAQYSGGYAYGDDVPYANEVAAYREKEINFIPIDPWRVIDDETNYAKGKDWYQFLGRVIEVQPNGIRVSGLYNVPGGYVISYSSIYQEQEFFVKNFPYQVAEDDMISWRANYTAKLSSNYTYSTAIGGSRTIHCLDYGAVWHPAPLTPEQISAINATNIQRAALNKKSSDAAALKFNEEAAAKGDAYGLLRMGERYRDGDGVETNLDKARDYFTKAVAAGNVSASNELKDLPSKP